NGWPSTSAMWSCCPITRMAGVVSGTASLQWPADVRLHDHATGASNSINRQLRMNGTFMEYADGICPVHRDDFGSPWYIGSVNVSRDRLFLPAVQQPVRLPGGFVKVSTF